MQVKISITLAEQTLRAIDEMAGGEANRSQFIEEAVLAHLDRLRRRARGQRDTEIINRNAGRLNLEVAEILGYQARP